MVGGCVPGNVKSTKQFRKDLRKRRGSEYELLGKYRGSSVKHRFRHSCGEVFETRAESILLKGARCPCLHTKKHYNGKTLEDHNREIQEWRDKTYRCLKFDRKGKCTYHHLVCDKTFKTTWRSFRLSKHCLVCSGGFAQNINRLTEDEVRQRLRKLYHGQYVLIGEYKGIVYPTLVKHQVCGTRYQVKMDSLFKHEGQCPKCYVRKLGRVKEIKIQGKLFKVQGHEDLSLPELVEKYGPENVITGSSKNRKMIKYTFKGKRHSYYPDFYIPSAKRMIEVKSLATLGLVDPTYAFFGEDVLDRNQAKARQAVDKGYKFSLHLYDKDGRLKVPANWYLLERKELLKLVRERKPQEHD